MSLPGWVKKANEPDAEGYTYGGRSDLSGVEEQVWAGRDRAVTLAEASDPHADYSFDDYALIALDGVYYLANTSGCSCPSPTEVWSIERLGDLKAAQDRLQVPDDHTRDGGFEALLRELQASGWPLAKPAPAARSSRYDW